MSHVFSLIFGFLCRSSRTYTVTTSTTLDYLCTRVGTKHLRNNFHFIPVLLSLLQRAQPDEYESDDFDETETMVSEGNILQRVRMT